MWPDLRPDVESELALLHQALAVTAAERQALLTRESIEPSPWERGAAAMVIHQCYTGIENVLKRTARIIDKRLPEGGAWHMELLRQVSMATDQRPAVVSGGMHARLIECLGVRHIARTLYGFALDWERLRVHVEGLPQLVEDFTRESRGFLDEMDRRATQ